MSKERGRIWLANARGALTHEEIASRAGIKRQYYSMIENGTRTPSVRVAKRIANILGIEWTLFFQSKSDESFLQISNQLTGTD